MTSKNQLRGSHLLYQITRTNKETKMSFRVESVWVNSETRDRLAWREALSPSIHGGGDGVDLGYVLGFDI
jgi:hypothetical protein